MNPKSKNQDNNQLLSRFKLPLILLSIVGGISFFFWIVINQTNQPDTQTEDATQEQGSSEVPTEELTPHAYTHTSILQEPSEYGLPPLNENTQEPIINYQDIPKNTEEALNQQLEDSLKAQQINNLRITLDKYFQENNRMPSSALVLKNFLNQRSTFTIIFEDILPLNSNTILDEYIYYSPSDINYSLNIPLNSLVILAQAKCNTNNDALGIKVRKHIVTQVNENESWGQKVNYIDANTTVEGTSNSLAMIFRLSLSGADYTYCQHDYMYNYDMKI